MAPQPVATKESGIATSGSAPRMDAGRALLVLALALTALAYIDTLRFQFVSDDFPFIVNNPVLHTWKYVPRFFVQHIWEQMTPGQVGEYYRPVFMVWVVINHTLFGLKPIGWHLTTVLLHLACTALVFLIGKRLLKSGLAAGIAAVLFGLHPVHVENVSWICGSTDPLVALFSLAAVLAYLRSRQEQRASCFAASLVFYVLAMLTKEIALGIPAVLLAYEWLWREKSRAWVRDVVSRMVPFAAAGSAYLVVRYVVLRGLSHPEPHAVTTLLLTTPSVLWFYVRHLVWPLPVTLYYWVPMVTRPGLTNFVLPLIGALAAVAVWVWAARRWREAAFAGIWLLVFLAPALVGLRVFIPQDLVHDRYLYLPAAGLAWIGGLAMSRVKLGSAELFGLPAAQVGLIAVLALAFGWASASQNVYWASDLTLFARNANLSPHNVLALNHLANEMYKRGRPETALAIYQRSLLEDPHSWDTYFALGLTQLEMGDTENAVRQLERATAIRADNSNQFYFLGLARMRLGRLPEAEEALRRAVAIYPRASGFHLALGTVLEKEGNLEGARQEYRAELANGPNPAAQQRLAKLQ